MYVYLCLYVSAYLPPEHVTQNSDGNNKLYMSVSYFTSNLELSLSVM